MPIDYLLSFSRCDFFMHVEIREKVSIVCGKRLHSVIKSTLLLPPESKESLQFAMRMYGSLLLKPNQPAIAMLGNLKLFVSCLLSLSLLFSRLFCRTQQKEQIKRKGEKKKKRTRCRVLAGVPLLRVIFLQG